MLTLLVTACTGRLSDDGANGILTSSQLGVGSVGSAGSAGSTGSAGSAGSAGSGGATNGSAVTNPMGGTGSSGGTGGQCCEEGWPPWGPETAGAWGGAVRQVVPTDTRPAAQAAKPPPAISGGTLGTTSDGAFVVVADSDRDRVVVINAATHEKSEIALNPDDEPGRIAAGPGQTVFVALRRGGAVVTIDPAQGLLARRAVCLNPRGLAYDDTTDELHVACAEGKLVTFTGDTPEPSRVLSLETDLRDVIVSNGHLLVSRMRSAELLELDGAGQIVKRLVPPPLRGSAVTPDNNVISNFVPEVAWRTLKGPDGTIHMLHQRGQESTIALPQGDQTNVDWAGTQGANNPCGGIIRNSVTAFDQNGMIHAELAPAVPLAVDAAVSPNGRYIAIASAGPADPNTPPRSFVDAQTGQPVASPSPSIPVASPGGVQVLEIQPLTVIPPQPLIASPTAPAAPAAIDAGADGSAATPESTNADGAVPITPATAASAEPPISPASGVSEERTGDSCDQDSLAVNVAAPVIAVAFDPHDSARLFALTRSPAKLVFIDLIGGLRSELELGGASVEDTGHELFHRSTGANIACASCHPEGRDDGRVWNFEGLGLRRTQPLDIGLANTAPFHWDGLLPDLATLMSEVFVRRMGGVDESPERLTALQRWLFARTPLPPRRASNDPLAVRGQQLFQSPQVGCSTCHTGASFTNNLSFDVGTTPNGMPLQVPGLRGIGYRSPLMHTGCAKTLHDRFDPNCGGGDHHGVTSTLPPQDIDALVAYLETL
ncbi:MAG TPA: hypothetical protein VL137_00185 [Polyangiaceae bacterium]|nr:hypothetical protein [Polyangiaceae bacterium]